MGLGRIKKLAELSKSLGASQHLSLPPRSVLPSPASASLSDGLQPVNCNNPVLPELFWIMEFITAT